MGMVESSGGSSRGEAEPSAVQYSPRGSAGVRILGPLGQVAGAGMFVLPRTSHPDSICQGSMECGAMNPAPPVSHVPVRGSIAFLSEGEEGGCSVCWLRDKKEGEWSDQRNCFV